MFKEEKLKRRGQIALLWVFIGLCFAIHAYTNYAFYGKEVSLPEMLSWELIGCLLWASVSPFIYYLAKKFPPQTTTLLTAVSVHLTAAALISIVHLFAQFYINNYIPLGQRTVDIPLQPYSRIAWRYMVYFIILIVCYEIESQKKIRKEEQNAAELRVQLAHSQLQALKMQLHPHFLFNTLNSISELMHQNIKAADEMIIRLSDFLRITLDPAVKQEITLEKEIEFLKYYLEIEQIRFKDRLSVQMQIDPETRRASVPYLILQPVVENAIRHGIAPRGSHGTLEIQARRENGILRLVVNDNGIGLPDINEPESYFKKGLGLSNTRSRLEKLYGSDFRIELNQRQQQGLSVMLEIPYREIEGGTR